MSQMENCNIWIRIDVNYYSLLEGTDELVKELKTICPVQFRKTWYPAACDGTEIFFQFFTDSVFGSFMSNVVFAGVAYDITKSIFKKVWESIWLFFERNSSILVQNIDFVFDDITICIERIDKNNYLNLALLFKEFHIHIKKLNSNGINGISYIRLPIVGEESAIFDIPENIRSGEKFTDSIWYIKYDLECNICYYNSNKKEILESC